MLNQFRTLLMNLSYAGDPDEHIPNNFQSLILPRELDNFYNVLFPRGASRFYTKFLTFNYLQLIDSSIYRDVPVSLDSRISYDLKDSTSYFRIRRNSVPNASNLSFPIYIYGHYINNIQAGNLNDSIEISQIGATSAIKVISLIQNKTYLDNYTLSFTNNTSQMVEIPETALTFQISGANFTSSSNKHWTFYTEDCFVFDFDLFYSTLKNQVSTVESMLAYNKTKVPSFYELIWRQQANSVYQCVGLLNAYTLRVNSLWEMSKSQ